MNSRYTCHYMDQSTFKPCDALACCRQVGTGIPLCAAHGAAVSSFGGKIEYYEPRQAEPTSSLSPEPERMTEAKRHFEAGLRLMATLSPERQAMLRKFTVHAQA